jgi:hypothetical protein
MDAENDLPDLSFGFVRVIREVKLLYLSLDLWPGPYGSIPHPVSSADEPEG